MTDIAAIINSLKTDTRLKVKIRPLTRLPKLPRGVKCPAQVAVLYGLCGGMEFLDNEGDCVYRILPPTKVVNVGVAVMDEAAEEGPQRMWFVFGEDDNGEHVVFDAHPSRSGACYDVFHETFFDASSATAVAESIAEFLQKLQAQKGKVFWLAKSFKGRNFDGDAEEDD